MYCINQLIHKVRFIMCDCIKRLKTKEVIQVFNNQAVHKIATSPMS